MSRRHVIAVVQSGHKARGKRRRFVAARQDTFTIPEANYRLVADAMGLDA